MVLGLERRAVQALAHRPPCPQDAAMRILLGLLLVANAVACAGTSNTALACQDQETRSCACAEGVRGAQECGAGAWSACRCMVPVLRDGGPRQQNDAGEPCVRCAGEICGNQADDDLDGDTDCEDVDCRVEGACDPVTPDDGGSPCGPDPGCGQRDSGAASPP